MPVSVSRLALLRASRMACFFLYVHPFLTRALEQPSLMFAVWGFDQALRSQVSFPTGRVHVHKLRSVMRIKPILAKDALLYAVREQLCVADVWVTPQ